MTDLAEAAIERRLRSTLSAVVLDATGRAPPADLSADADLFRDLGLDSFRALEFFLAVETEFAVALAEDDFVNLRTLRQFVSILERAVGSP
jgi:acyl carrier protein